MALKTVSVPAAVDGDTLVAQDDTILRLIGIDAPAKGHHGSWLGAEPVGAPECVT